ncbi:MAG: TRAP transporter substrate-binding protein DctP [Rhodospirillaceae bacterium]|nr:TRAP transporter substrate-binding protein DctP [Rhodospirillaceae bacterium]
MQAKISRRTALHLGAGAATGGTMLAAGSLRAQESVNWRMQALWDANTTPLAFEERFVARVAELTGGQFNIRLFSGGQLVPANQAFDAVSGGAFEMMKTFDGYEAGKVPAFSFTSTIPFGFPESDQYEAWFYELGGLELAREAYASAGLFYVAPTVYGQEPIHSTFPIHTLADMEGHLGRFVGLASSVMAAFGVAVQPMPTGEVYSALERGVIELADRGDLTANYEAGLAEVAQFIILPGVHQPTTATSYVANAAAYEALPDTYKAALAVTAREISSALRQHVLVQDGVALEKFREAGVEIITLDPAEIVAARPRAVEAWRAAAGEDELANRILDSQMAFMEQLGLI